MSEVPSVGAIAAGPTQHNPETLLRMILASRPGAHLASVASAFPPNVVDRAAAAETLQRLFPEHDTAFIASLVERSGVETRYIVPTLEEVHAGASFGARNDRWRAAAVDLAERAARRALERASTAASEIDVVIDVSCTGIAIPAIDVHLVPRLGLRPDARRIPITESGCAAGALALGMAATFAQCGLSVLIVAVELCSLTLVQRDRSRTNLVASVLFGDGAAAAVVRPGGVGPRIAAVGSHLIPDTRETMGFAVDDAGLRIVLQRELPGVLVENLPRAAQEFLESHGRSSEDVGLHLIHPGGRRILEAYEQMNGLDEHALRFSRESLRRYGNLSSASILTVLELALEARIDVPGGREAFVLGVGPGLSLEMLLLRWNEVHS